MIVIQAYNCAAVGRSANSYRSPDETSYRYAPHNFVILPHQSAPYHRSSAARRAIIERVLTAKCTAFRFADAALFPAVNCARAGVSACAKGAN